jgi:hypothetical protein
MFIVGASASLARNADCEALFLLSKIRKEFPSIGWVDFIRQWRMKSGVVFLFAVA